MKKNGGPAFPNESDFGVSDKSCGMSLRDYFASLILPHIIEEHHAVGLAAGEHIEEKHAVRRAYEYADLMLAERAK